MMTVMTTEDEDRERADLLETLAKHRGFLRYAARDLTDEQAAARPTVSELSVGGLVKHVAYVEARWARFVEEGPPALAQSGHEAHAASFRMEPGETLAQLLDQYEEVARLTAELVERLPSLDASQPLPEAPWFEPGARWTARRVLLHVLAETSQHAGHADIVRESIDGQKTMG
jgi:uncharacterized damage-inducible protein DinB